MGVTSVYILPEWMIATVDRWGRINGNRGGESSRLSVAATVREVYSAPDQIMIPEQQISMAYYAQSPSQRSDGDCVLRLGTPVASKR
jgi:hypothetical protein